MAATPVPPTRNDFIELFNRGTTTVSLTGMVRPVREATGTGNFGANPVTRCPGRSRPASTYLVQQAGWRDAALRCPTPDAPGPST